MPTIIPQPFIEPMTQIADAENPPALYKPVRAVRDVFIRYADSVGAVGQPLDELSKRFVVLDSRTFYNTFWSLAQSDYSTFPKFFRERIPFKAIFDNPFSVVYHPYCLNVSFGVFIIALLRIFEWRL